MPKVYERYHDQFLRNFAEKNENKILGTQRFVFCKHKSEYIFPCYLVITVNIFLTCFLYFPKKPIVNPMRTNLDFVGSFNQHKSLKEIGYLIYNTDGMIEEMTSSKNNQQNLFNIQISRLHRFTRNFHQKY